MATITREQLVEQLMQLKGSAAATFTATTEADVYAKDQRTKQPIPFARPIQKTSTVNGMVNFHYDVGVLRRLEKEGKSPDEFRAGTSWHQPILDDGKLTPLCAHKSDSKRLYVRFMRISTVEEPSYKDAEGKEVNKEDLKPYMKPVNSYANQGLEDPLVFLTYSLDSIQEIRMGGDTYTIMDALEVVAA